MPQIVKWIRRLFFKEKVMNSKKKKAWQYCQAYFNHPNCTLKKLLLLFIILMFIISFAEFSFLFHLDHHLFQFSFQGSFFPDQMAHWYPF